jgi:hypothetical protein
MLNLGDTSCTSLLRLLGVVTVAMLCWPASLAAAQQSGEEIDAGQFEIRIDGRRVGTEVFAVRRVDSKIRAVGRLQVEQPGGPIWPFEVRLQTNARFEPEIYELRFLAGPTHSVGGRRTENGILIRTATDEGERFKEYGTGPGTLILERGAAHHFVLLFEHLGTGGVDGRSVQIIVPSRNEVANATIRRKGQTRLSVGGADIATTLYEVSLGGRQWDVWLDSGGRIVRIEMSAEAWQATRTDGE